MKITINDLDQLENFIETADISKEQLFDVYKQATKKYLTLLVCIVPPKGEDDEDYTGNLKRDTKETIIEKIKLAIDGIRCGRPYVFIYYF